MPPPWRRGTFRVGLPPGGPTAPGAGRSGSAGSTWGAQTQRARDDKILASVTWSAWWWWPGAVCLDRSAAVGPRCQLVARQHEPLAGRHLSSSLATLTLRWVVYLYRPEMLVWAVGALAEGLGIRKVPF